MELTCQQVSIILHCKAYLPNPPRGKLAHVDLINTDSHFDLVHVGAVGCVRNVANPISLARLVMEKTEHVFLAGDAVREFAISTGIPLVPTRCLINSNFTK